MLKTTTQQIFNDTFGYAPTHTIQAPGRVNLIGEHTDYNDGFVLPCAIDYQTVIACAKRDDRQVRVVAVDYDNQQDSFSLDAPILSVKEPMWANYVRGVVKHLQQRDASFGGCVVALMPFDLVDRVKAAVAEQYEAKTDIKETFYVCTASEGAGQC